MCSVCRPVNEVSSSVSAQLKHMVSNMSLWLQKSKIKSDDATPGWEELQKDTTKSKIQCFLLDLLHRWKAMSLL